MSFKPGENIGSYRIVEQLGSGGMATVFKAYHASLDRYVAIKVMHAAFRGDPNFMARFQREARVVARLEHPHIVPVYDFSEHEGSPYLVMRFVEGETLKARQERGRLSRSELLDVIGPVGQALDYAHEQGVLHRDIKPSNVILTPEGGVFLTDFGLARMVQAGESSLTRDGMVGTPFYISPEQAKGVADLDARTDVYSLGVVLYELFTGQVPFRGDTPFAVIHDHIFTPLPLPSSITPDLPKSVERVLLKALSKEREDRYESAGQLVAALEQGLVGAEVSPEASRAPVPAPAAAEPPVDQSDLMEQMKSMSPDEAFAPWETRVDDEEAEPETPSIPSVADSQAPAAQTEPAGGRRWLLPVALGTALVALVIAAVAVVMLLTNDDNGRPRPGDERQPPPPQAEQPGPPPEEPPEEPLEELPELEGLEEEIEVLLQQSRDLAEAGDIDGAMELAMAALEQDPGADVAYQELAFLLLMAGDFQAGIETLQDGLHVNPESAGLHLALGRALVAADQWPEAVGEFQWLLDHEPGMAEPYAYMAVHLAVNEGDLQEAQRLVTRAREIDPDLFEVHFALGVYHWKAGNLRQARLELERARTAPNFPPWMEGRIRFFLERISQDDPEGP